MTQMSQTADAQDCRAKILRCYHTWVLLSGVCGKEWGVDLLANAVTRELLGCTVVKRNIKPFAVWTWYEIWAVWVAKIKWKAVSAQLGYVQETNLGYKARELSLSPEAAFHHIQITTHGCSLNSEPYRHHQQTKVAVRDWFWRRDAVLLTVKGNMQNSIQEIEISPFLRAAGPLANETHVLIIEDADMIFICATAVCVLHVDRVVINCRTCVVRVAVVTVRWCKLLWARQRWMLVATLGSRDSSLCPVPLRLAQNGRFSCLKAHACLFAVSAP